MSVTPTAGIAAAWSAAKAAPSQPPVQPASDRASKSPEPPQPRKGPPPAEGQGTQVDKRV